MVLEGEEIQSRESMKQEAEERMRTLGLPDLTIHKFMDRDELILSDNTKYADVPEDILREIKQYEKEFDGLVYHVIHTHIFGMETYECLSVSPYKEDWDYERPDKKCWVMSHSINKTFPENTESGSIQVVNKLGVLCRVN